jgi:hypothetical protein
VTIVYADDPARYKSAYAYIVTTTEVALRQEGKKLAPTPEERARIAEKLHATWTEDR